MPRGLGGCTELVWLTGDENLLADIPWSEPVTWHAYMFWCHEARQV